MTIDIRCEPFYVTLNLATSPGLQTAGVTLHRATHSQGHWLGLIVVTKNRNPQKIPPRRRNGVDPLFDP